MTTELEAIMVPLRALIEQARSEGKWLFCHYQALWFSPDELTKNINAGKFRWGVVNWQLRDPAEYVAEARQKLEHWQRELSERQTKTGLR